LKQTNLNQAETKINETTILIGNLTAYFSTFAAKLRVEKISAYINASEQNLSVLKAQFNSVSNLLSSSAQASASVAINQAQTSLSLAKQYSNSLQLTQTVDALTTLQVTQDEITQVIQTVSPSPSPVTSSNASTSSTSNTPTKTGKP
jgi:hypothetical protein